MSPKRLRPHSNSDSSGLRPSTSSTQSGDGNISIIDITDDQDSDIEEVPVVNSNPEWQLVASIPSGVPAAPFLNLLDSPITRSISPSSASVNHIPTGANRYVSTPPLYIPATPPSRGDGANQFVATPPPPNIPFLSPPGASRTPQYAVTPSANILNRTVDLTDSPLATASSPEKDLPAASSPKEDPPAGSPEAFPFSCPVCLDNLPRIKSSGRDMMSTVCGHIFCSSCLSVCFKSNSRCPTCRKILLSKDMHQIFI